MKLDVEKLQLQREENDQRAKQSMIARMQSGRGVAVAKPELDCRPVVTLRELAERLKMDRSACRRYVLALGYEPVRQRTADSGYQVALTFTARQADEIFQRRHAEGYC